MKENFKYRFIVREQRKKYMVLIVMKLVLKREIRVENGREKKKRKRDKERVEIIYGSLI